MTVIDSKIQSITKNLARLSSNKTRNAAEKTKLTEACKRDLDKLQNDLRELNFELKRLPKDREAEYQLKVTKVKKVIDTLNTKHQNIVNGVSEA